MKYIKKILVTAINIFRELKLSVKILLAVTVVVFFMGISIVATGQPGFCNSCHIMNRYYSSWEKSSHSKVECLECHLTPGVMGLIKGKINGLSQAIDCIVGRVGTKPNAVVEDVSCLRAPCHSTEKLVSAETDFRGIRFEHKKHIARNVDGVKISCTTCHSHFEGNEHFEVESETCFTCHFLKESQSDKRLVQTDCLSCHKVPDKIIERGLVSINHAEFVFYKTSCEESCHKKQIEQESKVSDTICLNCHDFGKDSETSSQQLHSIHTAGEKVECFACHGNTQHGTSKSNSVAEMMDCESCHSDTHNVQLSLYTSQHSVQDGTKAAERVLSPMFLTHVECTGCHIEQVRREPGTRSKGALDSFGTVAKAVPRACDKCHEEGVGQQYTSFWQKNTRKLYKQVSDMVDKFENRIKFETNKGQATKLKARLAKARVILDSVSYDGSWGVHNFKYTETMLLKARELVNE